MQAVLERQQVGREVYQGREAASIPSPCVRPELQCLQRASARSVVHARLSLTEEGRIILLFLSAGHQGAGREEACPEPLISDRTSTCPLTISSTATRPPWPDEGATLPLERDRSLFQKIQKRPRHLYLDHTLPTLLTSLELKTWDVFLGHLTDFF